MLTRPTPRAPHVKICGVTQPDEIRILDAAGVSFAGLWCGVPEGAHNLDASRLAAICRTPRRRLKLILVTLERSATVLASMIRCGAFYGVQLHGFQLPSTVRRLRQAAGPQIRIFKVLHVQAGECAEAGLIDRYRQAGVDRFILDTFEDRRRIGSTGIPLSEAFLKQFIPRRLPAGRVMIAGGIDAQRIAGVCRTHRPYGVDVDSGARRNGRISARRVSRIMQGMRHEAALRAPLRARG